VFCVKLSTTNAVKLFTIENTEDGGLFYLCELRVLRG
jgi:hypothetical protein